MAEASISLSESPSVLTSLFLIKVPTNLPQRGPYHIRQRLTSAKLEKMLNAFRHYVMPTVTSWNAKKPHIKQTNKQKTRGKYRTRKKKWVRVYDGSLYINKFHVHGHILQIHLYSLYHLNHRAMWNHSFKHMKSLPFPSPCPSSFSVYSQPGMPFLWVCMSKYCLLWTGLFLPQNTEVLKPSTFECDVI